MVTIVSLTTTTPIFSLISSTRVIHGTARQDDWCFYYDVLSLMTACSTIAWMKEKGYMSKWIVPQGNVNFKTCYYGKLVGNSPEFVPFNNSFNTDIKQSHDKHVAITCHLPKDDLQSFVTAPINPSAAASNGW